MLCTCSLWLLGLLQSSELEIRNCLSFSTKARYPGRTLEKDLRDCPIVVEISKRVYDFVLNLSMDWFDPEISTPWDVLIT